MRLPSGPAEIIEGYEAHPTLLRGGLVTGWPVPDAAIGLYRQAEALRRAPPGWSIAVQPWTGDRARIEAVNRDGGDPYCLISTDPPSCGVSCVPATLPN